MIGKHAINSKEEEVKIMSEDMDSPGRFICFNYKNCLYEGYEIDQLRIIASEDAIPEVAKDRPFPTKEQFIEYYYTHSILQVYEWLKTNYIT